MGNWKSKDWLIDKIERLTDAFKRVAEKSLADGLYVFGVLLRFFAEHTWPPITFIARIISVWLIKSKELDALLFFDSWYRSGPTTVANLYFLT